MKQVAIRGINDEYVRLDPNIEQHQGKLLDIETGEDALARLDREGVRKLVIYLVNWLVFDLHSRFVPGEDVGAQFYEPEDR